MSKYNKKIETYKGHQIIKVSEWSASNVINSEQYRIRFNKTTGTETQFQTPYPTFTVIIK